MMMMRRRRRWDGHDACACVVLVLFLMLDGLASDPGEDVSFVFLQVALIISTFTSATAATAATAVVVRDSSVSGSRRGDRFFIVVIVFALGFDFR